MILSSELPVTYLFGVGVQSINPKVCAPGSRLGGEGIAFVWGFEYILTPSILLPEAPTVSLQAMAHCESLSLQLFPLPKQHGLLPFQLVSLLASLASSATMQDY